MLLIIYQDGYLAEWWTIVSISLTIIFFVSSFLSQMVWTMDSTSK